MNEKLWPKPSTRRAALAQWQRKKQREGTWKAPCIMQLPNGRRCWNMTTRPYCDTCWERAHQGA